MPLSLPEILPTVPFYSSNMLEYQVQTPDVFLFIPSSGHTRFQSKK